MRTSYLTSARRSRPIASEKACYVYARDGHRLSVLQSAAMNVNDAGLVVGYVGVSRGRRDHHGV